MCSGDHALYAARVTEQPAPYLYRMGSCTEARISGRCVVDPPTRAELHGRRRCNALDQMERDCAKRWAE
jgi:hypothetical protein